MLSTLIFLPLLAAIAASLSGRHAGRIALAGSLITFAFSIFMLSLFDPQAGSQFIENHWWVQSLGISYKVGLDGISLLLVLSTTFLLPIIILSSLSHNYQRPSFFYSMIMLMQFALIGVFSALDGFLFYVFWELALIPIYLICLMWGGNNRF